MLLTLQIAAGIVLAYAIIANRQTLLRWGGWLGAVLAAVPIVAALFWLGSQAIGAASPYVARISPKFAQIALVAPALMAGLVGGISLLQLARALGWKKGTEDSDLFVAAVCFLNVIFVWLVAWPFLTFTIVGDLYSAVDGWSRNQGYADTGAVYVTAIFCLWPLLPLWLVRRRSQQDSQSQSDGEEKLDG